MMSSDDGRCPSVQEQVLAHGQNPVRYSRLILTQNCIGQLRGEVLHVGLGWAQRVGSRYVQKRIMNVLHQSSAW